MAKDRAFTAVIEVLPMGKKREVRTFVRHQDDLRAFGTFEDALVFLGMEAEVAIDRLLDEVSDQSSTIFVFEKDEDEEPPATVLRQFAVYPREHRGAFFMSGVALMYTMPSRDPALVVDAGEAFFIVVSAPALLKAFVAARYAQTMPLETPPENVAERWVVSIAANGGVHGTKIGVGTAPGTATA